MKISQKIYLAAAAALPPLLALMLWLGARFNREILNERNAQLDAVLDVAVGVLEQEARAAEGDGTNAKERAARALRAMSYGEENYLFVLDADGNMLVHPSPDLEGSNVRAMADVTGKRFFAEMIDGTTTTGRAVVEYVWPKSDGTQPEPKVSRARLFRPWGWIVASGLYLDDVAAAVSAFKRAIYLAFGLVVILGGCLLLLTSRGIARNIGRVTAASRRIATGALVDVDHKASDETGELAEAFRGTTTYLREVAQAADRLGRGDLTFTLEPRSAEDTLAQSVSRARDGVRVLVEQMATLTAAAGRGDLQARADLSHLGGAYLEVAVGVNATLDALAAPVDEARAVIEGLAGGDFSRSVEGEYQGDHAQLKVSLNRTIVELRRIVDELRTSAETVAAASTEIRRTSEMLNDVSSSTAEDAQNVSASSQQVGSNVESVASATEEMSSSIREISNQMQEALRVARDATSAAAQTSLRMDALATSSARIGEVLDLITTIAERTNLLALNATIEAARAGESGKGFAVVAHEVKQLAMQTRKATDEIGQTVQDVQARASEAVRQIETIGKIIQEIEGISASVASAIEEQSAATEEISRNVNEAARTTALVVESILKVTTGAQRTSSAAAEASATSERLVGIAAQLERTVQRFQT